MRSGGLSFAKGHGLGNDYLVVDAADLPFAPTPGRVTAICDRHTGLGSDGLLVGETTVGEHDGLPCYGLRIFNPDGSEAEKSGNGLRIFAAWLHGRRLVRQDWFAVRLMTDTVRMRVDTIDAFGVCQVTVEIGRASFRGADVGLAHEAGEVLGEPLDLGGGLTADITTVSVGNPHCVVIVDQLDRDDFLARAPRLCTHPAFARGINVQFARVAGPQRIEAWIWERGAGETLASGSSSCAVAAACVRRGLATPGELAIVMPGGQAAVSVSETHDIVLRGPARMVAEFAPNVGWLEELMGGE